MPSPAPALCAVLTVLALPLVGCDSPPDRFNLEGTQFVHAHRQAGLVFELNHYIPKGETLAKAEHVVVLGTPRALAADAAEADVFRVMKANFTSQGMHIGYEDAEALTLCAKGTFQGRPIKALIGAVRADDGWATVGEIRLVGANWRDADPTDICTDGPAESAMILELGRVLLDG